MSILLTPSRQCVRFRLDNKQRLLCLTCFSQYYESRRTVFHASRKEKFREASVGQQLNNLDGDRIAGLWPILEPSNADYKEIIKQLPKLLAERQEHLSTALFFATPGLAKWFTEDHPFHTEAINRIYRPCVEQCQPESAFAIVDALPVPCYENDDDAHPYLGCEGIAVCLMPHQISGSSAVGGQDEQALIRFHSSPDGVIKDDTDDLITSSVTLPVANTLFINGFRSTMFKQAWKASKDLTPVSWVPAGAATSLSILNIPAYKPAKNLWNLHTDFKLITPPRRILSSMGNVLREVEGDDGAVMKASTELEVKVPEFIKEKQSEGLEGNVQVFAVIRPEIPVGEEVSIFTASQVSEPAPVFKPFTQETSDHNKAFGTGNNSRAAKAANKLVWMTLWNGGKILRVTGGGGGWGKKQGLLSLDTATDFAGNNTDTDTATFPTFGEDDDPDSGSDPSKKLLPAGSTIQFCATLVPFEQRRYHASSNAGLVDLQSWKKAKWKRFETHRFIAGTTVASEMPVSDNAKRNIAKSHNFRGLPGIFGMLSYGGTCLSTEAIQETDETAVSSPKLSRPINQSRFDIPNSIFESEWLMPIDSPPTSDQVPDEELSKSEHTETSDTNIKPDQTASKPRLNLFKAGLLKPSTLLFKPMSTPTQPSARNKSRSADDDAGPPITYKIDRRASWDTRANVMSGGKRPS